ncbi:MULTISPECIES: hypothetical protein [unclassified Sphingomonas]|jgi:hypothetical protein|nr:MULTISPECIES: hypothetical protein [unclassified Sphingomonas]
MQSMAGTKGLKAEAIEGEMARVAESAIEPPLAKLEGATGDGVDPEE